MNAVTQLNRPPNAAISPNQPVNLNSSNNQSNGGYKRKENVRKAQKEYDDKFRMQLFEGKGSDKLSGYKMQLPIDNRSDERTLRIIDLYMHHRTQQLMCLEFDMSHLKLADAEASFQSFEDMSTYG